MTPQGWTVMILSVGTVLVLVCFCLIKVLSLPPVDMDEALTSPLEIDTGDTTDTD